MVSPRLALLSSLALASCASTQGPELPSLALLSIHDLAPSPSQVAAQHAEQRLLLEGLRRLPLEHQLVLELYFWEPLTAGEIGEVLDLPEGTVRTRIRRAKQLLLARLRELDATPRVLESTLTDLERWASSLRAALTRE